MTPDEAVGLEELMARAERALDRGDPKRARGDLELAWLLGPRGDARQRVLLDLGTAWDLEADSERALAFYLDAADRPSQVREVARVRALRLLVHLDRYDQAARLAADVATADKEPLDELAVRGARALGAVKSEEQAERERAAMELARARELIERHGFDRVDVPPLEVAAVFFGVGELERQRALAIRLTSDPRDFAQTLERRCRHILDAQAAYSQAMRSRSAHWSAMAGVRVGELYFDLHRDLMAMGPQQPSHLSADQTALFWGAMRLRYGILLRKAVSMLERTLEMLDRTGEPTPFRALAQQTLAQLRAAEQAEEAALDALPYSREELRAALRRLSLAHGGSGEI